MLVVTYSDARKTLAAVLDRAKEEGAVLIRRADGSCFRIVPEHSDGSPLDIPRLPIALKPGELGQALADARRAADRPAGR
jgi:antitoxin (DNA-binding transcriptional repressor) of toxin-antitoxin stability system